MKDDKLFRERDVGKLSSFAFDQRVVEVFDDMVNRSVPGYATIQLLVADLALQFAKGDWILDVGCSTGNTILALHKRSNEILKIVGIDQSREMVEQCREKVARLACSHTIEILHRDILDDLSLSDKRPRVVIINLVLQFVRPLERVEVLKKLQRMLLPGGCLILVEKTIEPIPNFNRIYIDYYHRYKLEMGYSELEISRKREALENCLIPFTREENTRLLTDSGFGDVSTFFQWMNFCGFIAIKSEEAPSERYQRERSL